MVVEPCVVLWLWSLCCVGVAVVVFAPRVVSWSRSLRCMWFRGPGCYAAWASRSWLLRRVGVAVAVFAPCVVSQSWSLCRVGVVVAVFAPHVVLWSWSLCHMWFRG